MSKAGHECRQRQPSNASSMVNRCKSAGAVLLARICHLHSGRIATLYRSQVWSRAVLHHRLAWWPQSVVVGGLSRLGSTSEVMVRLSRKRLGRGSEGTGTLGKKDMMRFARATDIDMQVWRFTFFLFPSFARVPRLHNCAFRDMVETDPTLYP